jgi:hypothetical protein
MNFEFGNVHADGELCTKWDFLLRIVGDFALWVRGKLVYREVEFCLVEFALALAKWLSVAPDSRPNFIYMSLESETEGLVRFERSNSSDYWRVSAAHEYEPSMDMLTTDEVESAAIMYLRDLRARLSTRIEILDLVEDPDVREALCQRLG